MSTLAMLTKSTGRLNDAYELERHALGIRKRVRGDSDALVAISLQHLGVIAHARGDSAEAVSYDEGALDIQRQHDPSSLEVAEVVPL
jgi:hypothetical protein